MALLDLYKVTKTLTDLLLFNITKNIDPTLDEMLNVTAIPPEKVESPSNQLNFFLYHIAEDTYYKNTLGLGSDVPNVAKSPMALNLFYILTAHHERGEEAQFDAETEQKLMGYGLKTFHDFPVITDRTQITWIDSMGVLQVKQLLDDPELRGKDNSLEVILRPVSPEEAIAFWGSEETRTVRLSAYYEVRVILLEPEPPKTMPGIVLHLGTYLVQLGSPHLERSQSLVLFQLPERNGGSIQQVEVSPARVTLDSSPEPPERPQAYNRLLLLGTNLTKGRSRTLVLKNNLWSRLELPDPEVSLEQAVVDLAQNPNWQVTFASDRIEVVFPPVPSPTLTVVLPDTTSVDLPLLPGCYSALVKLVMTEQVINGELKQITATSNEIGFAIAPRIIGNITLNTETIDIEIGFDPENLQEDSIQVIFDSEVYTRADEPLNDGEFTLANTPSNLVRINPPFSLSDRSVVMPGESVTLDESIAYPFRMIVNGAESAPFWIELTSPP